MSVQAPINASPAPPTDDELNDLYEEVKKGFSPEFLPLGNLRISMGEDLSSIIGGYLPSTDAEAQPRGYKTDQSTEAQVSPAGKVEEITFPRSRAFSGRSRPLPKPPMTATDSQSTNSNDSVQVPIQSPCAQQSSSPRNLESSSSSSTGSGFPVLPPEPAAEHNASSHMDYFSRTPLSTAKESSRTTSHLSDPRPRPLPVAPSFSLTVGPSTSSRPPASGHPFAVAVPHDKSPSPQRPILSPLLDTSSKLSGKEPLSRSGSTRPKGALAPSVPGHSGYTITGELSSPVASNSSADVYTPTSNSDVVACPPTLSSPDITRTLYDSPLADPASNCVSPNFSNKVNVFPDVHGTLNGSHPSTHSGNVDRLMVATSSSYTGEPQPAAGPSNYKGYEGVNRDSSFSSIKSIGSENSDSRANGLHYIYRHQSVDSSTSPIDNFIERFTGEQVLDDIKRLALHDGYGSEEEYDDVEEEDRFVDLALLSHVAVRLRDRVPRGTHVKGGIPYSRAFTGKDIVSTIQAQIQRELVNMHIPTSDRRLALQLARSLQGQLFFFEVEWGSRLLQDGVEDVYMFLDDREGNAERRNDDIDELPNGVFTPLAKCYSPSCLDGTPYACYSWGCPRQKGSVRDSSIISEPQREPKRKDWAELIDDSILKSLPESEKNRQTIIHKAIDKEELYVQDLDLIESLFMKPLRAANPPVIAPYELDSFMEDVFHNILNVRDVNKRLLEVMEVRQREQQPIIQKIGDVFLNAATEFRIVYVNYVGNLPIAEKRLKDEMEQNAEFRLFLERCLRQQESRRMDLKHFLQRPAEQLQKYPIVLEAIFNETEDGNPDADFLLEAVKAIQKLQSVAQLRTFQTAMGKGPSGTIEYYALVSEEARKSISKQELKRQSIIFELIQGEMMYVRDLESIGTMYIEPLRNSNNPIIPHERLSSFLHDAFHNYSELLHRHRLLLERLHEIQRDEHPVIRSIVAPILDAALNLRDAYMAYIPNNPIAHYRIEDEMQNNQTFKIFADATIRNPDSRRLDMKNFVHRPVARLARYELLLSSVLKETPANHEDQETIPQTQEVLKGLLKETNAGVKAANERVEIWRYNQNLVFKSGEAIDMDLLDENRSLIHSGKLLRQPETGFDLNGWTELFVLLFDNYLVMTKTKEKDGVTKYHVNKRPIPLDLLTLANFTDPPQQRGKGILGNLRGGDRNTGDRNVEIPTITNNASSPDYAADSRSLFPCTIHHNGRLGGLLTLYAESQQARAEWKQKLDEAIVLRKVVTDANKVFEVETLSSDTFLVPSMHSSPQNSSWNDENIFTGKVTCSVPFSTADGRGLVAIGCAEGVWIGLRHDPRSLRRVLHLKMVSQCAMLEDFGIFLVLADKALFAYHIEALVPSSPPNPNASRTPQKLNGNRDVQFFTVGSLLGRTLVIYMKRRGIESVFRVLEPVISKINEKAKTPGGLSRFGFGTQRSEWFRVYRDFFLPSESYDLLFLKAKIAILCSRGFEIMNLIDFKSETVPQRDDPRLANIAKRCESCKPMGMFRSQENEFLLVYNEFGLYVDRHGDPSRTVGTIEWEGTAERVAWHPPYILLFDSRFIEIRHVETGRLAQIIPGKDIRCIWDGRGASVPPLGQPGPDGWTEVGPQEARVHAVMQSDNGPIGNNRAVAQHVFQLVPTIPLYLPGSLSSPPSSLTYFPQSSSPPHSPSLGSRMSWR